MIPPEVQLTAPSLHTTWVYSVSSMKAYSSGGSLKKIITFGKRCEKISVISRVFLPEDVVGAEGVEDAAEAVVGGDHLKNVPSHPAAPKNDFLKLTLNKLRQASCLFCQMQYISMSLQGGMD